MNVIEEARSVAESLDADEALLVSLLVEPGLDQESRLSYEHHGSQLVNRIVTRSNTLLATLKGGMDVDGVVELSQFYSLLASIKEHHRRYPAVDAPVEEQHGVDVDGLFTGEERIGKYLDLVELHADYSNLAPSLRVPYLVYLQQFAKFSLPRPDKLAPAYSTYLTKLLTYLTDYYSKVFPLEDLSAFLNESEKVFVDSWEANPWPTLEDEGEGIWCSACGKSYSKRTVYDAHLSSKKHQKATLKPASSTSVAPTQSNKYRSIALKESLVVSFVSRSPTAPLAQILKDTISNGERKAALTDRERAAELEEWENREFIVAAPVATKRKEVEEEDDGRIYNPLKLPMGWDGKPIPFWLYKLHGLGVEFKCEICSDFVYMGRKTFEKHFQEARHSFGMRALGLPNTKHFSEITRIEDAIACTFLPVLGVRD